MNRRGFRLITELLLFFGLATFASAQIITTLAGNVSLADNRPAKQTPLVFSRAVTMDSSGFIYVGDDGSGLVRRIDPSTGIATIIAGGGTVVDDLIPVQGKSAFLNSPLGLAIGPGGRLYIADDANNRIRMLTSGGLITTVAGNGTSGFSGDGGPATRARLYLPAGVAVDPAGNLYISDRLNAAVRKVSASTGIITTIAGGPNATQDLDNIPATDAKLFRPWGLAVDSSGNIFIADSTDHTVRMIEGSTGLIFTVVGRPGSLGSTGDGGLATDAKLWSPHGVVVAPNGDLYISQVGRIRKVAASTGIITTLAGVGNFTLADGRPGTDVFIPDGIGQLFLTSGNILLMALEGDSLIAQINLTTGIFSIVAGNNLLVGDGGLATNSAVSQPDKLALDATGNLFITDTFHHRVRKVAPGAGGVGTGTITTVAGTGVSGLTSDGSPAATSALNFPEAIFVDSGNNLYFSDDFRRIRKVGADGILRTVAGSGSSGYSGDGGLATSAQLNHPRGMVMDSAGNLYIADSYNDRVRKVSSTGIITTIAGNGTTGFAGNGGPATAAQLNTPVDVLLDGQGNLLIAEEWNHWVRGVNLTTGIISTFAGTGDDYNGGDGGPATSAAIYRPRGLAKDAQGNIYITALNYVRKVNAGTRIITTIAGSGDPGYTGDGGLATLARMSSPSGIVVDSSGNIIFSDLVNNRIRRIAATALLPVLSVGPTALTFNAVQGGASPPAQNVQIATTNLAAASWSASVSLNSGSGWLSISPSGGVTPGVAQISVNPSNVAAGTYTGVVRISAPNALNSPQTVNVTLNVAAAGNPKLSVDRQFITFRTTQGGGNPASQTVQLTNAGGGVLQWSATLQTSGGNWLSLSPTSGTGAATLTLSATLGSLPIGVYQGLVLLSNPTTGETLVISVNFLVSQPVTSLLLSQTGALFTVNEGATFIPNEAVQVINGGQGAMSWNAQVLPLSGGNWLTLSPSSGTSTAGVGTALSLAASPENLRAGVYDALVTVTATGANNSPQVLLARLNVQASGTPPVGNIKPGGLALVGVVGGGSKQDTLTISTSGGSTLSYVISASTADGAAWLSASPPGGGLQGSADSATIRVQANPAGLVAGVYRGKVAVAFSTGVTQDVGVLFVVTSSTGAPAVAGEAAAACVPQQQLPLHTSLLNNFSVPYGWPTPVLMRVLDNCGAAVTGSTVFNTFSTGEDVVVLRSIGNGVYSGTWTPSKPGNPTITAQATGSGLPVGKADPIGGSVGALNPRIPLVARNGVVNGASYKQFAPLAPGEIISLFGLNLAKDIGYAGAVPLPRSIQGVIAKLGGVDLPLYYVAGGQINAQVPFELPAGGTFPMVVTREGTASAPELVTLAGNQPGIFSIDSSGTGLGAIQDAVGNLINAGNPARRGDVIVVYANGLGATTPAVKTGEASPGSPPATANDTVTAFVGNVSANVEFAGLSPGFVGLYQVNVRIPANAPTGDAVEIYLVQNQISSNKVTLVIR